MNRIKSNILVAIFLMFLVSACKIGHEYVKPVMELPEQLSPVQTQKKSIADLKWWEIYKDTVLIKYINIALENNKDMKIATARLREYMALRRIATSDLYPRVDVSAEKDIKNNHNLDPSNDNILTANLSWELDLWGNIRWAKEAALAEYYKSEEGKHTIQMELIASIATNYFDLLAAQRELQIIKGTDKAREEGVELASLRYFGGLTSEIPLKQAQVEYSKTRALIPAVEYNIIEKRNQLSFLMGLMPQDSLNTIKLLFHKTIDTVPVGLPSELLMRRPDVRSAEQDVIAANANVGVSLTNMFPRITLTAKYGLQSEELSSFLSAPYSFLAGSLLAPIFNAGANRAKLKASKAVLEQKIFAYEKAVLTAFQETDNSISRVKKAKEVRKLLSELESSARNYLQLAQLQYINGVTSYLDVLDAQRLFFDAEVNLNKAIRDELVSYIILYKALGGGW